MKILFIGARLFDDIAYYLKSKDIECILTESNKNSSNLDLADKYYIVDRGMDQPAKIAISNNVCAVIPLIGLDIPLMDVAIMKKKLEEEYNIPVIASNEYVINLTSNKSLTKEFFNNIDIATPNYAVLETNDISNLNLKYPMVLKQNHGQGGKDIKIAINGNDLNEYFDNFSNALAEEFIEGSEISIEVLCWNGEYLPLVPAYKGETNLNGVHPLYKVKSAPCEIDGLDNNLVKELAIKIAKNLGAEGTIDIDFIYSSSNNKLYAIEVNARPSGTRYLSAAGTGINPLVKLVDMAYGDFDIKSIHSTLKNYYSLEIPIGEYKGSLGNEPIKKFEKNSWVVHGPEKYRRITVSGENKQKAFEIANNLLKYNNAYLSEDLHLDFKD
ncbi:ATP-grasp domain-containing protein [Methanobrevibacter filiformis]|nr:ATP-grasp domain-containing protein [Methanobrevibacter filiformis]